MKIKWMRRVLLAVTFVSTVVTVALVVFKVVQKNNLEVETKVGDKSYRPIRIDKQDYYKVLDYKRNSYVFDLKNTEYYLMHKTLKEYPELANRKFTFSTDLIERPKQLEMTVSGEKEMKWFYSII